MECFKLLGVVPLRIGLEVISICEWRTRLDDFRTALAEYGTDLTT